MKTHFLTKYFYLTLFTFALLNSCNGQENLKRSEVKKLMNGPVSGTDKQSANTDTALPIDQYVVNVFEDIKGNLWFGTLSKGAARYDGIRLTYLSMEDGLTGNTVIGFAEDKEGNIWIGTHSGLSKYDGRTFTNFTVKEGLSNDRVSCLLIDKSGILWIGTWGGVFRYDGKTFSGFPLPLPDIKLAAYQNTMDWVTELLEDRHGNIWIARDGYGVCKYDGKSFTHFTKKDGLASSNVQAMEEDRNGNMWFGSRVVEKDNPDAGGRTGDGGLSRLDGKKITRFPGITGLSRNDIYAIYKDHSGNIWIGANGTGAYRYDGKNFTLFSETNRKDLMTWGYGIQDILEDKKGTLWLGLSGGLFRLKDSTIIHVSEKGPW